MRDIRNNKHYNLYLDENGLITFPKETAFSIKNDDVILFPISTKEETLIENYKILKNGIKNNKLFNEGGPYSVSFDVSKNHRFTYDEWKILIDFAKKVRVNFRINFYQEYTAEEMENYINKFVVDSNGNKDFVFDWSYFASNNNPLLKNRNVEEMELVDHTGYESFNICKGSSEFEKYLKMAIKNQHNSVILRLPVGEKFDKSAQKRTINIIEYMKQRYKNIKFDINFGNHGRYYDKEEFKNLLEVEEYIKRYYYKQYELKFSGDGSQFTKSQIINANSKIEEVVETLKKSKLSPYEKIAYVHKLLSEFQYVNYENKTDLGRNLYSVLNTRNMICVGYSALFKAILDELNDENIKCKIETLSTYDGDNEKPDWHAFNCVYLKDDKYNIEGYYNIDACINNTKDSLDNFMIPSLDIDHSYAYASVETTKTAVYSSGNLYNQTIPFAYTYDEYFECEFTVKGKGPQEQLLRSTADFLNTDMGKRQKKKLKIKKIDTKEKALQVINECIKYSIPISMESTKEALKNAFMQLYDVGEKEAIEYTDSAIYRSYFNALFLYERHLCWNKFAEHSIQIENGEMVLNKNKSTQR